MSTIAAARLTERPRAAGLGPALVGHAVRLVRRGALIMIIVAAGLSGLVVWQYRSLYGDGFDAGSLQALTDNPAIRILFGAPVALDTAGGFTVWRTGTPMAVLLGAWAVLTAVRVTRGEEEAGRWDQLLVGRFRLTGLVITHLGVVIAITLMAGGAVAIAMLLAGAEVEGSIRYGVALSLIGAGMAALGALTGQLIADRRRAVALAAVVLGAGLLVRMIGDGTDSFRWLLWLSPFGLLSISQPFASNQNMPLAVLLTAVLLLVGAIVLTSRRRDLQAGILPVTNRHRPHTVLLRSLPRYAIRRSLGPLAGWAVGVGLYFLLIGVLAASLTRFLSENPRYAELAAQAGFPSMSTVEGYVAALFALLAIPIGLFAASRISASAADEDAGRLTMVLAGPVSRQRWYLTETVAAALGCLLLATTAGLATWVGATIVGVELAIGAAVEGTVNVLPIGLLSLAAALVAFGWAPHAVLPIGAIPSVGGFLLQVLAENLRWPGPLKQLSPFAHLNPVPYEAPDWAGGAAMIAVSLILATIGLFGFTKRDLRN